jgi:hypothetical protein
MKKHLLALTAVCAFAAAVLVPSAGADPIHAKNALQIQATCGTQTLNVVTNGIQLGPRELAAQHGELVPEHNDLELFELVRAEPQRRELQKAPEHEVAERPEQTAAPPSRRDGQATLRPRTGRGAEPS